MFEKPKFRSREYATTFQEQCVVDVYHHRAPYPEQTFELLSQLIVDEPKSLLDVGTGIGNVARGMLPYVDCVDAVDFSEAMIQKGRGLSGGDDAKLQWIYSEIETAPLNGPYALITAGGSLHWFDHNVVMPLFADLLTTNGHLAIVERNFSIGLDDGDIIAKFSENKDFIPYNLLNALEEAGLFVRVAEEETEKEVWTPTVAEYLASRHSQNGLSQERMGDESADAFDAAIRDRVEMRLKDGSVRMDGERLLGTVDASVVWGKSKKV